VFSAALIKLNSILKMRNPYFSHCCTAPVVSCGTNKHQCRQCGVRHDADSKFTRICAKANKLPDYDTPVKPKKLFPPLCKVAATEEHGCTTTGGVIKCGKLLCFGVILRDTRNRWEKRVSPTPLVESMIIYSNEYCPESDWHCFEAHYSEFEEVGGAERTIKRLNQQTESGVSVSGRVSKGERFDILKRDNYKCQICGRTAREDSVKLHVDHKVPKAKGGTNDPDNLWVLCKDCNLGKGTKLL
jgi:hypothetical protein